VAAYDNITRRMRFTCWMTKTTETHLEYTILISSAQQKRFSESNYMLPLYANCLACFINLWHPKIFIFFFKILKHYSWTNVTGWFRVKGKSPTTFNIILSTKSIFLNFDLWCGVGGRGAKPCNPLSANTSKLRERTGKEILDYVWCMETCGVVVTSKSAASLESTVWTSV
jgi:hypothetical protein